MGLKAEYRDILSHDRTGERIKYIIHNPGPWRMYITASTSYPANAKSRLEYLMQYHKPPQGYGILCKDKYAYLEAAPMLKQIRLRKRQGLYDDRGRLLLYPADCNYWLHSVLLPQYHYRIPINSTVFRQMLDFALIIPGNETYTKWVKGPRLVYYNYFLRAYTRWNARRYGLQRDVLTEQFTSYSQYLTDLWAFLHDGSRVGDPPLIDHL